MNANDQKRFTELIAGVHDFYGKPITKFAAQVWWQACQSFDYEQLSKAFSSHLMDPERGQFLPKPADIVRAVQGTSSDRSLIAWGKVLDAMQRVGAYTSVCFDDPAIHATIEDLGGWAKCCRSTHDELSYLQKRFCDSYKAYANRGHFDYPARLAGEHEQANAGKGYKDQAPTLIGDPDAAKQVLRLGSTTGKTQITAGDAVQNLRIGRAA